MPHSKTELICTIERRLRQRQSQAALGDQNAAFFLAIQHWRRHDNKEVQRARRRFQRSALLLAIHDAFHAAHSCEDQLDTVDQIIEALKALPRPRLKWVADHLDHKGSGRAPITLADLEFDDFHFWLRVTKRKLGRMTTRTACGAAAGEDGDRTAHVDSLVKRYRRIDKRFGDVLRHFCLP